jgi:hypothetical protein
MLNIFYIYRYIRLDTNLPFYIGKGKGNRYKDQQDRNQYFLNIVNYTPFRVEIILDNLSEDQALKKEVEFIKLYKSFGFCEANLTSGGEGVSGWVPNHDWLVKNKSRNKGECNPMYGKKHTAESNFKNNSDRRGKKLKDILGTEGYKNWIISVSSEEYKAKISEKLRGKTKGIPKSNEHKLKLKLNNSMSLKVLDSNGRVYLSVTELSKFLNFSFKKTRNLIKNKKEINGVCYSFKKI